MEKIQITEAKLCTERGSMGPKSGPIICSELKIFLVSVHALYRLANKPGTNFELLTKLPYSMVKTRKFTNDFGLSTGVYHDKTNCL